MELKEIVKKFLKENDFDVVDYSDIKSSIDFVAKKGEELYVIRVLGNLDALRPDHADDMLKLAHLLGGTAVVVAERSRWGPLKEGTLYYRHGVPAMNFRTFRELLGGKKPEVLYTKGKEVVKIDKDVLKRRREELGYSLQKLAELTGTTKETIYRYERGYYATREMAERLENILGTRLIVGFEPKMDVPSEDLHFPFTLLRELGSNVKEFRRLPWEAIAKRRISISFLLDRGQGLKMRIRRLVRAKGRLFSYYLVVGRERRGIPYIEEEEISEAKSFKEIEKIARERNEEASR